MSADRMNDVAREECALFLATYPTPNVRRACELASAGRLSWVDVRDLFIRSLGTAVVEVTL